LSEKGNAAGGMTKKKTSGVDPQHLISQRNEGLLAGKGAKNFSSGERAQSTRPRFLSKS
jgi:hypothetical protein